MLTSIFLTYGCKQSAGLINCNFKARRAAGVATQEPQSWLGAHGFSNWCEKQR